MGVSKFFVWEGIDGSGSTSVTKKVAETLNDRGVRVVWTKEPSNSRIGKMIKGVLSESNPDIHTLALLFAADRLDHFRSEILPALVSGNVVICDRYRMSALAYQAPKCGLGWVQHIDSVPDPAITILLNLNAEKAMERIEAREKGLSQHRDCFETLSQLRKIRQNYLDLVDSEGCNYDSKVHVIDASQPFDAVVEESLKVVSDYL